jgi:hypothetical protein
MKKIQPSARKRIVNRSITLIAAAVVLGLLQLTSTARADDSVGAVTQVTGIAQIQRGGVSIPAQAGTPVKLHDTVMTQPDSTASLGFADGSSMALTSGTSLTIEDASAINGQTVPTRVTLNSGNVHTNVPDKTTGQVHHIEIDTQSGKVTGSAPN